MPEDTQPKDGAGRLEHLDRSLQIFIDVTPRITASLYQQLPINESNFVGVSATAWKDGRSCYLYAAADEVCKAGIAMRRWGELLNEPKKPVAHDPEDPHADRLVRESLQDEQRMWQRKLTEWLANLVCFSTTNEQSHYRLFLAAEAYEWHLNELHDLRKYCACDSGNVKMGLEWVREALDRELGSVSRNDCWFLKPPVFSGLPTRPGQLFTSASSRVALALKHATPNERVGLGITYGSGFGRASRSVHPSVADVRPPSRWDDVEKDLLRIGLICINVINRAHLLAGLSPHGTARGVATALDSSCAQRVISQVYAPGYEAGDLALAMGHLAEIIETRVSDFDLESYRVRFLVRGPLKETPEDWVPADQTRAILRRSWGRAFLEGALRKVPEREKCFPILETLSDEELTNALRAGLVKMEQNGLPLYPLLAPPRESG